MSERLVQPADIRSQAQLAIAALEAQDSLVSAACPGSATDPGAHAVSVLDGCREQLAAFFLHRSNLEAHGSRDAEAEADTVAMEVENVLCEILLGVMTRGAIFAALDYASNGDDSNEIDVVDYTTPSIATYPHIDGEHQFMCEMVRLLDAGVKQYYARPHTAFYRQVLHELIERYQEATAKRRSVDPSLHLLSDLSSVPVDLLFDVDRNPVQETLRVTLRHNADTAMAFAHMFPGSVLQGFENFRTVVPEMTVAELATWFRAATPVLATAALARGQLGSPGATRTGRQSRVHADAFQCHIHDGRIVGFSWSNRLRIPRRVRSNCPAAEAFPGFSAQERQVIDDVRRIDDTCVAATTTPHSAPAHAMSTAEALLRVTAFAAPAMWQRQYEAHELCPELQFGST